MAHSALHFSLGMLIGSAVSLPPLFRAWFAGRKLARSFAVWILLSAALGILALAPGLLRRIGVPDAACDGWWMNLFVFYPALNKLLHGGTIYGVAAILACFTLQYALLLAALARRAGESRTPLTPTARHRGNPA